MGTRTTATGRFTAGQPDGLNVPVGGFVPGLPPFVWMTGGGTPADNSPTPSGMTRILDALTDSAASYSICQPNVRWSLGGPGTTGSPPGTPGVSTSASPNFTLGVTEDRIDDAVAWARANLGATDDPPILMGVSNGWVCSIIYAYDHPVTGIVGVLPVTAAQVVYDSTDPTIVGFGLQERIEEAWNSTHPTYPTDPKWDPQSNRPNYPDMRGKIQAWYTANDVIYAPHQMAFLQQPPIFAEMHNLGAYGHLGELFDAGAAPTARIDTDLLVGFVDALVAGL